MSGTTAVGDRPVYISAFGYALGAPFDIGELAELRTNGALERMRGEGISRFCRTQNAPWELAAASAQQTLERCAEPVDLVVYCTDSFRSPHDHNSGPAAFIERLSLARVPLVGVGLHGCGNVGAGVRVAAMALCAGVAARVLLVTTDVAREGARLMGGSASVLSDGAASCVVSASAAAPALRVRAIEWAIEAGMHRLSSETQTLAMVKATADGVRRVTKILYQTGVLAAGRVDCVIMNNYGKTVRQIFSSMTQVPIERFYAASVGEVAHCFSADVLINIARREEGGMMPGELFLLLSTGHHSWTSAALEYVDA